VPDCLAGCVHPHAGHRLVPVSIGCRQATQRGPSYVAGSTRGFGFLALNHRDKPSEPNIIPDQVEVVGRRMK
jgi:hypothetical protein